MDGVRQSSFLGLVALMVVHLGGCATTAPAHDFQRPSLSWVESGQTTRANILRSYGTPTGKGEAVIHDRAISTVQYEFQRRLLTGGTLGRACTFYFVDDRLRGYAFVTENPTEESDLEGARVAQIKKGVTTKSEVVSAFGAPTAVFLFPTMTEKDAVEGESVLVYAFFRRDDAGLTETKKVLRLFFDAHDVVKDVSYAATEPVPPKR